MGRQTGRWVKRESNTVWHTADRKTNGAREWRGENGRWQNERVRESRGTSPPPLPFTSACCFFTPPFPSPSALPAMYQTFAGHSGHSGCYSTHMDAHVCIFTAAVKNSLYIGYLKEGRGYITWLLFSQICLSGHFDSLLSLSSTRSLPCSPPTWAVICRAAAGTVLSSLCNTYTVYSHNWENLILFLTSSFPATSLPPSLSLFLSLLPGGGVCLFVCEVWG